MNKQTLRLLGLSAVMIFGLSACAALDENLRDEQYHALTYSPVACANDTEATSGVNWAKATQVDYDYGFEQLTPMVYYMNIGDPYVVTVTNSSGENRHFTANSFFRGANIESITVDGEQRDIGCLYSIHLRPEQTAELRLVPTKIGRFEVDRVQFPLFFSTGAEGVINVR